MRRPSLPLIALLLVCSAGPLVANGGNPTTSSALAAPIAFLRQLFHVGPAPTVRDLEVVVSSDSRSLILHLSDGSDRTLTLTQGRLLIDGVTSGHYAPGGDLERTWQGLLSDAARLPTALAVGRFRDWHPDGLAGDDAAAAEAMESRLARLEPNPATVASPQAIPPAAPGGLTVDLDDLSDLGHLGPELYRVGQLSPADLKITVPGGQARLGHYSLGSGQTLDGHLLVVRGDADIFGTLRGNLATVDGDVVVHPGAVVTGSVLAVGGQVREAGGDIAGGVLSLNDAFPGPQASTPAVVRPWQRMATGTAGVLGVFLTLGVIGAGLVAFARPQLEVVGDTVAHSFGRALLVGLLGEVLLVPTFGMMVVGLALTVVGIVLVPFAVAVYVLLAVVAILGGLLGAAHAMGETWTRRRLATGHTALGMNSYSYLVVGLGFLLALWACDILFGWVPVAGDIVAALALLVSWLVATAGFGAALLSRAGLKDAFSGRIIPPEALTDEYLWATPQFGVPAIQRPSSTRTPPPRP